MVGTNREKKVDHSSMLLLLLLLAKRRSLMCLSFCSFYCAKIWKLWTMYFLWNFDFD